MDPEINHQLIVRDKPVYAELDPRIANLVSLIYNNGMNYMKQHMVDVSGFDSGKLSVDKLPAASVLKVEALCDENKGESLHALYQRLHCELTPLDVDCKEFSMIESYIRNTSTEAYDNVDIIQIFKAFRKGEDKRFEKFYGTKNRMLLWHGSRLINWIGILSQGLRIAPPESPSSGSSFGKGVYFADMFSKSAEYCRTNSEASDGVLALCEVALGDVNVLLTCDENAENLLNGKLSTKGMGKIAPDLSESHVLEDGVIVPLGKPNEHQEPKGECDQNEYIVYTVDQIRIRYIVHVNFSRTFKDKPVI